MITTCSDPDNIFSSRWEFSWLTKETPREHLEELVKVSDVVNAWMHETSINHSDPFLYIHPWYWLPLISEENAYGAKLSYGANPRDEVMEHLRRKRPAIYQYPSALFIVCTLPPVPGAVKPAGRGVGTSTASEMGFPALKYRELPPDFTTGLREALDEMAKDGHRVYEELREEMYHA